jgi:rare lipoprotein A
MRKRIAILFAGMIMLGPSFAQYKKPGSVSSKSHSKKSAKAQFGTASYYANKFNGRKTANGDVFSQHKMTAACNHVSLNTWVRVTNLRNHKAVVVKVTDRMHPQNKRLIDLSRSAASHLGYTGRGLAKVKVEVLGKVPPEGWKMGPFD